MGASGPLAPNRDGQPDDSRPTVLHAAIEPFHFSALPICEEVVKWGERGMYLRLHRKDKDTLAVVEFHQPTEQPSAVVPIITTLIVSVVLILAVFAGLTYLNVPPALTLVALAATFLLAIYVGNVVLVERGHISGGQFTDLARRIVDRLLRRDGGK